MDNKENCLICKGRLKYLKEPEEMECVYCHKKFISQTRCENGHFICDECHSKDGDSLALEFCLKTDEEDPYIIAQQLFKDERIHIHGPEHHVLVPSVLTAAYLNKIDKRELKEKYLLLCKGRGKKVPGGSCGYAGCCGAGVGVGIFFSVIQDTSPLNSESWGKVNLATGRALMNIGKYNGPRCCKRNTFLAFDTADEILKEQFGVSLVSKKHYCGWFGKNEECLKETCQYYPKRDKQKSKMAL